jgi:Tfp pilus assembly protein PilF
MPFPQKNFSRLKRLTLALALGLAWSLVLPAFAQGQLQSWNTNQREKAESLLSGAMTALNKTQLERAAALLIEATQADPTDAAPFAALGLTYVRQGKYAEALEPLRKSYQISRLGETLLSTGFAYYLQHDYDAAIASWTKALERDPRMVEAYADMGFAYMRKGDFVKAYESFRTLIKSRPSSQLAYQGLAVLNYLSGNFSAARKAACHAQSIQSYFPVLLLQAQLDFLQGDPQSGQKRVSEWQRATAGKRALVRSMTALGYPVQHDFHWDPFLLDNFDNGRLLMDRTDSNEKAKKTPRKPQAARGKNQDLLSRARQSQFANNRDFFITRELALIEMAGGDYASSAQHFREVLQICPACVVDWLHLARDQAMLDKTAEASYAIRAFQKQRPSERIAPSFLELAKGQPAAIPELSPQSDGRVPKLTPESGF